MCLLRVICYQNFVDVPVCHSCERRNPAYKVDFKAPGSLIKSGMTLVGIFLDLEKTVLKHPQI